LWSKYISHSSTILTTGENTMKKTSNKGTKNSIIISAVTALNVSAQTAFAASTGSSTPMPWDGTLTMVKDALTGTTVHTIAVLLIVGAGLGLAMGEGGGGSKKIMQIVLGLGIALGAASLASSMGSAAGCVIPF
jgi:type IV secretory pathway VirB2 component (pilin)